MQTRIMYLWLQMYHKIVTKHTYIPMNGKTVLRIFAALMYAATATAFEIQEPCDSRFEGCFSRNLALPKSLVADMKFPDPAFQEFAPCPLVCYSSSGAQFEISKRFDNPQIQSVGYLLHGLVEADILAAPGKGIILSFYLQSDDKDEIDIAEIFGSNHLLFQTNYFVKGDTSTHGKGIYVGLESSPLYNYHRYGVNWTSDEIEWSVDGVPVRTVKREPGQDFPSSPMRVRFSMWAGGDPSNEAGTMTWAGGLTDYTKAPFRMYVRNIRVVNAAGGVEYTYSKNEALLVHNETTAGMLINGQLNVNGLVLSGPYISLHWALFCVLMLLVI